MNHQHLNRWLIVLVIVGALIVGCQAAPDTSTDGGSAEEEIAELQVQLTVASESGVDAPEIDQLVVDGEATQEVDSANPAQQQERMIIKNGAITLLVADTDGAVSQVTQVATDSDGYVLSSEVQGSNQNRIATLTIAVRSDQFESAMDRLRGLALEVVTESASGQDVTGEFVDLESRLRTLEITRDRIQGFLDQAQTVEEAMDVSRELASIDEEIEQVRGRMKYLSGRSAYSTITVQLRLEPPEETPEAPFTVGETLSQALGAQAAIFQGLVQLLIWLVIVPGPYLVAGGLVFAGFRLWSSRRTP